MASASVSFDQTEQDVLASYLHFLRRNPLSQPTVRASILFGFIAIDGVLWALLALSDANPIGVAVGLTGAASFGFFTLWLLLVWWRSPTSSSKPWLREPELRRRVLGPHTVSATTDGLAWTHPLGSGTTAWAGVSRIDRAPQGLYISLGSTTFIAIPAAAFPNAEHMEYFAALADHYRMLPSSTTLSEAARGAHAQQVLPADTPEQ